MAPPPSPPSPGQLLPCRRCGASLYPVGDLAALAKQISDRGAAGLQALDRMRLAIPSSVGAALQEARLDGAILARRLACHAGSCPVTPELGAPQPSNEPRTESKPA